MTDHASANSGTTAIRPGFELDEQALAPWIRMNLPDFYGPLQIEQFKGGQSNPTYKVAVGNATFVLRRQPPGTLLKGAHAVDREARVLTALAAAKFPVAKVQAFCADASVIGSQFYIMEMVEGRIFWDAAVSGISPTERAAIFDAMNDTIARLHNVDYEAVGLGDFGRAGGYFERQISRWSAQYRADPAAGISADMDSLIEWLVSNIPEGDETSIVHGDFRIDNMIFHPSEARVLAVLDWELSTLGHPLADFAYNAMMYRMPPHIIAGLVGVDLASLNIPTEADYIRAYCERTGREGIPNYPFYMAFVFFRLAAIFHGIAGRVMRGSAASAQARERAAMFPELAALGRQQISSG